MDDLTCEYTVVAASVAHATPLSGSKRPVLVLAPNLLSSPSKNYPDYSITKSSGDSAALGNDSGQWEVEGDWIPAAHTRKMQEEEVNLDAESEVTDAIAELEKFSLCGRK
jgi:hypothetical protein